MMGYLGLQDDTRKRITITQAHGKFNWSIVRYIEGDGLFVTVSQKKWDRVKGIMASTMGKFNKEYHRPELDLKF